MFGTKKRNSKDSLQWPSLLALLEDDDRRAAIQQIAPSDQRRSFLEALSGTDDKLASTIMTAGRQLNSADALVSCPTVAVAGMLNSGKTSLVSTFLSEKGRARTLRGTGNDQGTHRFVLWLPAAWKEDAELWQLFTTRIGDALGAAPESLSDDVNEAHSQYNNRGGDAQQLNVPLVATDPALDQAGIGLLDCPDIVSDASLGLGSPEMRREFLGQAATLCSAFLVVTSAESSRDSGLSELFRVAGDLMPGLPRYLAVNKARPPQTPDQVLETFRPLAETHGVATVFAAYDYDVPKSRPFVPLLDAPSGEGNDPLPVFYSLRADAESNPPATIKPERLLSSLPAQLDRGELFEAFQLSLRSRVQSLVESEGLGQLESRASETIQASKDASECLLNSALDFFAHRDSVGDVTELRLHQNERIIRQLSEAFATTAPWYARWGVRMNATVQRIFGGVKDFIKQLTPSAIAQRAAEEVKDKFKRGEFGGLITPENLIKSIERNGGRRKLSHWSRDADWNDAASTAILRFEQDDFTSLDPRRLDEATRQMWAEIPRYKKLASGITPLVAMLATFAAVLTIPIDFGANAFGLASISELFAAGGLTGLSVLWAGNKSMQDVGGQAAKQQLADFHAVLCDVFGVPRVDSTVGESAGNQPLPNIQVAGKRETLAAAKIPRRDCEGPTLSVYRMREEFRSELARQFS